MDAMTLDLSPPDDAPDHDPSADLQSLIDRVSAVETRAADASAVDELAGRLDKIETRLARPSARIESGEDQAELERKAWNAFLRQGSVEKLSDLERKTLSTITTSPGTGGWNLVPETFLRELLRNLIEFSPMRSVARVQQVSGNPVLLPKRLNTMAAAWVAEEVEHGTSEPAYGQQSVPIFEARVTVEVTNALLEDAAFDIGAELALDFAEEFGRLESLAFVRGNGTSEPEGFRTSANFVTSQGTLTADALIDLYHSVPAVYANRGTWLMPRSVIGQVRKLKATGTGNYLWAESLQPGNPPSLLGRPVVESPELTAVGSPSPAQVAFGDWNRAYRIFDRVGLQIMRDETSGAKRSVVMFHARRRVGGALVDGQAVRGLSAG
jgi:HK97 family phage major capsid protein